MLKMRMGTCLVLLEFDTFHSLQSHIISACYDSYSLTLHFEVQLNKVDCIISSKNVIKYVLKRQQLSATQERNLTARKIKYHEDLEKKLRAAKKRNLKQNYYENPAPKITYQKGNFQENLDVHLVYRKSNTMKIQKIK